MGLTASSRTQMKTGSMSLISLTLGSFFCLNLFGFLLEFLLELLPLMV